MAAGGVEQPTLVPPGDVLNVGKRNTRIDPTLTFDQDDPKIRDDIVSMVAQWLEERSVNWIDDEVTLAKRVVEALNNPQQM